MQQTVVGVFDSVAEARKAVNALTASGMSRDRVQLSEEPGRGAASAGATASSTHAGDDDGMLSSIRHFFAGLFDDEDEHSSYAEAVRRGGAIVKVTVDSDEELDRAASALDDAGAVDIDKRADAWRSEGWQGGGTSRAAGTPSDVGRTSGAGQAVSNDGIAGAGQARTTRDDAQSGVIPVIREQLELGKRTVGAGGVRVFARTVSEPVNQSVNLRTEHADVARRPVDRPATEAELSALEDRTIEVQETAEKAVVSKVARVVEEVSVGKTVENRTEQVSDTVRHTEVEVEKLGAQRDFDRDSESYRTDFQTRYGNAGESYDDYEPAYRYGHGLRSDKRFAGRDWDAIEPDARRDWESRNPGSTWEKFKGAVRHAWEKVSS